MIKVLLVEDDNNLREIYEARLAAEGYDIVTAKDGEEALVVAKKHKPELIISDVMMPRISGFEMLDILRSTNELKGTKIIMLTALGQSEDKERAEHLGADRYLVKSQVTLEDIVKSAKELIEGTPKPTATTAQIDTSPVVPTETTSAAPAPIVIPETSPPTTVQPSPAVIPTPGPVEPVVPTVPPTSPSPLTMPTIPLPPAQPVTPSTPTMPTIVSATVPVVQPEPEPEPEPTAVKEESVIPVEPPSVSIPQTSLATPPVVTEPELAVPEIITVVEEPQSNAIPVAQEQIPAPELAADEEEVVASNPQTTGTEEATVEQQIDQFVQSNTPSPSTESDNASLINSAVDQLQTAAGLKDQTTVESAKQTKNNVVAIPVKTSSYNATTPGLTQIPGKKVIQPLFDDKDKTDLATLVAQEEINENSAKGVTGTPVVADVTAEATDYTEDISSPLGGSMLPQQASGSVFTPMNDNDASAL